MSGGDGDDEWRFTLEDLEDGDEDGGNVAGSFVPDADIEPEAIALENAAFVLLGALVAGTVLLAFVLALT